MSLYETAKNYESMETFNIADLSVVPLHEVDIETEEGTDKDGQKFSYKFFMYSGKKYRVPNIVLNDIKGIIADDPKVEFIKVKKSGTGLQTRYQVLPSKK